MSSLSNQQINSSFSGLLQVPGGITSSLQQVQDGNGNTTGLFISSTGTNTTTTDSFVASKEGIALTDAIPRLISDGFGDSVSVKDFGAIGDGVADDTIAIQNAVSSIISVGGGSIYFPSGNYKISSAINFNGEHLYIYGDGIKATNITATHNGYMFHFTEDYFVIRDISFVGPLNPAYTSSTGIRADVRFELGVKVGAQNYSIKNVLVNNCYNGLDLEGSANSLLDGIQTINCYNIGIRCVAAQGKWNSLNVATSFSHGLSLEPHPTPGLGMASPFISNLETFANGGYGVYVQSGMGLQLIGAFINNDSKGGIYFNTNPLLIIGQITNAIIQFCGVNPFDPRTNPSNPYTGNKNAAAIQKVVGATGAVIIDNLTTYNNAGCDIKTSGSTILTSSYLIGCGGGIPASNGQPAEPASATDIFAFQDNGGANRITGCSMASPVQINGNFNTISTSFISNNSSSVPAFDVAAASQYSVFTGLNIYQNNGAGISFRSNAGSIYYVSNVSALGGSIVSNGSSNSGDVLPNTVTAKTSFVSKNVATDVSVNSSALQVFSYNNGNSALGLKSSDSTIKVTASINTVDRKIRCLVDGETVYILASTSSS